MARSRMLAPYLMLLLACAHAAHAQVSISWNTQGLQFRASGGAPVTITCPPQGRIGQVWGTDVYTDDSSVCSAAVHAGLITLAQGGTFTLTTKPGMPRYAGSMRYGVTSRSYEEWEGSFSLGSARAPTPTPVVRPLERAAEPQRERAAQPDHLLIPWDRTAARLAPNGKQFTFQCPARGTPAPLKGDNIYSWDSSICTAAVHAGAITLERGGIVTIQMRPGTTTYSGSTRNGITSTEGKRTTLGFAVIQTSNGKQ